MPHFDNNPVLHLDARSIGMKKRIRQRTWRVVDIVGHITQDGRVINLAVWRGECRQCGGPMEVRTSCHLRIHTSNSFMKRHCPACRDRINAKEE